MNELQKQFIDFVNSQPNDKVINHYNGWEGCAVGEFIVSITGQEFDYEDFYNNYVKPLFEGWSALHDELGENYKSIPTYGDLAEYISNHLPTKE